MKTASIIIAVALLAIAPAASAQKKIKEAFADVEKFAGVTKTGEQNTSRRIDTLGITCESSIVTIMVKKDYYDAVFDKLKKAFESESKNATMTEIETAGERPDFDPVSAQMLGQRKQWSVWREGAEPVLIGGMGNSTYLIANYDDKQHPDYRTCCAAEWSKTVNPDVYKAQLVYVYGRKPEKSQPLQYSGTVTWPSGELSDRLKQRIEVLRIMADTLAVRSLDSKLFGQALSKAWTKILNPQDILQMTKQSIDQLPERPSDWHRVFGLLTQKMIDGANKDSHEDLVVTAGIILDLCKNASQLDADEREISARRLEDVAEHYFAGDKYQYIHDLLMLGAKKLRQ